MVMDGVLQDALKQHRQLGHRIRCVFFGQLQHRILHDIERRIFIADCEKRLLVSTPLDFREKRRDFLIRSQFRVLDAKNDRPIISTTPKTAAEEPVGQAPRGHNLDRMAASRYCLTFGGVALQNRSFAFHPAEPQALPENPWERSGSGFLPDPSLGRTR